jgi:hypothetical protein
MAAERCIDLKIGVKHLAKVAMNICKGGLCCGVSGRSSSFDTNVLKFGKFQQVGKISEGLVINSSASKSHVIDCQLQARMLLSNFHDLAKFGSTPTSFILTASNQSNGKLLFDAHKRVA